MADYGAQAAAIYNPQEAADEQTLAGTKAANDASYLTDTNGANQAYNQALTTETANEGSAEDKVNASAAAHGLTLSGLAANGIRLTYQNYQNNVSNLSQTRASKLAEIAGRQQADTSKYNNDLGALKSKYQAQIADYVSSHQNDDAKQAQQEAAAAARQQAQYAHEDALAAAKAPTGYGMTRAAAASADGSTQAGSLSFHGPNGQPISIGSYYAALGGSTQDIASTLSNGTKSDQKIASDITGNKLTAGQIQSKYPWLFQ